MSFEESNSVLHKKARHGREDFDARAMSPSKALRLAIEKCGDRLFRLALTVCAVEQRSLTHGALKSEQNEECLILLLDGPHGSRGSVLLDRQFTQALVEVQTMGSVRPSEAAERPFTGTDAAIAAPLINAMLDGFDAQIADAGVPLCPLNFRFGDRVADMRSLMLALDAPDFELFGITVDIAGGAKTGMLTLILPETALCAPLPDGAEDGGEHSFDLSELAMSAPVTLDAVLDRVQLPLHQVCQLAPGMTLPIAASAVGQTELVAAQGHTAAVVRLGQMNGFRAVRIMGQDGRNGDAGPDAAMAAAALSEMPGADAAVNDAIPDLPDGLEIPDIKTVPDATDLSDLPGLGGSDASLGLTDLPDQPDLPNALEDPGAGARGEGADGFPALPDLPGSDGGDLPDLTELPGLPDLPSLEET